MKNYRYLKCVIILLFVIFGISTSYSQDKVYTNPDKVALYPGGSKALTKFIKDNLKYPEEAKKANINGVVEVSFIIEKTGGITSINITKGLGHGCDEEACRIVRNLLKWYPASVAGQPVRSTYKLSIKFPQS